MKKLFFLLSLLLPLTTFAAEDTPPPVTSGDTLAYLEQLLSWRRDVQASDSLKGDARQELVQDRLEKTATRTVQKGFDFARAQAALLPAVEETEDTQDESQSRRARIKKSLSDVEARIAIFQAQAKTKQTPAAREKIAGDLKLAMAQRELLTTLTRVFSNEDEKNGTLLDQINALAQASGEEPQAKLKEDGAVKTVEVKTETKESSGNGVFSLAGELFSLSRRQGEVADLQSSVTALKETNRALITSTRASLREALAQGNALSTQGTGDLDSYHRSLDTLLVRYQRLSSVVVPLGEINMTLANAERHLQEWQRLLSTDSQQLLRRLLFRLTVLAVALAIPFALSELARRAIRRYVQDDKRRKQLRVARRILLALALLLVVLANFMTEFGSLATFAGFITAGLAVALQTVLVSLVAHFFFFGRYGVRAGDRITVGEVTGDVLQIGMLRLYVRQLEESEQGLRPSGKVVAFPNSILFQPTAFYKHVGV